jgi:hypothetical protein
VPARLRDRRGIATFAALVLIAEVAGRSLTGRVDRALHVEPLAPSGADYYPFLLVGVKIVAALACAGLLMRATRAWAAADALDRLLGAVGHGHVRRAPRLRPGLSPRLWLASFASTSLLYLVHADAEGMALGRWPLLAPWLHTYALPIFAVLAVVLAGLLRLTGWLDDVEDYAVRTIARVRRLLTASVPLPVRPRRAGDDTAPRRRFGLAFESRPPPLPA